MAFPKTINKTDAIIAYSNEVIGRIQGILATDLLISDPNKQKTLADIATSIQTPNQALLTLYVANHLQKVGAYRTQVGLGRGHDFVFGRHVANVSESIRTGPALGSRDHAEYRKVFKDGNTKSYVDPTVREDPALCEELARCLQQVNDLNSKTALLDATTKLQAALTPVAETLVTMEKQQSKDFTIEVEGRQAVIDALWSGKKMVEAALGRDRGLVKFIFFDFDRTEGGSKDDVPGMEDPAGGPDTTNTSNPTG